MNAGQSQSYSRDLGRYAGLPRPRIFSDSKSRRFAEFAPKPFVLPIFRVLGVGFKASLILPVGERAAAGSQYAIGSAEQWQKVVENLGALVKELDRTFVPDIERAAGPTPEWYRSES